MVNLPSKSVVVPILDPETITEAPGRSSLESASKTVPETEIFCAAIEAHKNILNKVKVFCMVNNCYDLGSNVERLIQFLIKLNTTIYILDNFKYIKLSKSHFHLLNYRELYF